MSWMFMVKDVASLSTVLVARLEFLKVVTVKESDGPFWLGEVKVITRDTDAPAGRAANPVICNLGDKTSYKAVSSK